MKNISIFSKISVFSILITLLLFGCAKNKDNVYSAYDLVDISSKALIKVNYNVAFYNNPGVQIKINGVRVSGTTVKTRYPFPGGGFNTLGGSTGDYLPVNPGANEISITIPKRGTSIDSLEIYKTTVQTNAGSNYSLHVADSLNRKSLFVEEDYSLPDSGFVRMKFVNLMANVPSIDLYIGSVKVASNIAFMTSSTSFTLPTSQSVISTAWTIRPAGAAPTSTAIATYTSASTLLNRRVYTAFANGYNGYPTGGTDVRKPYISFYYVR